MNPTVVTKESNTRVTVISRNDTGSAVVTLNDSNRVRSSNNRLRGRSDAHDIFCCRLSMTVSAAATALIRLESVIAKEVGP